MVKVDINNNNNIHISFIRRQLLSYLICPWLSTVNHLCDTLEAKQNTHNYYKLFEMSHEMP